MISAEDFTPAQQDKIIAKFGFTSVSAFRQAWENASPGERELIIREAGLANRKQSERKPRGPRRPRPEDLAGPVTVSRSTNAAVPPAVFQSPV